ncbi:Lrp/AsnC family transcriptional regulator [Streptomyces sp. NPDC004111]|uniref:Lrp/AsnC family transcriptional regulator n=1 Tax=Streptomyces sp. NPDC004111 TaxID=3364690 RepID=UPI0036C1C694
MRTVDHHALDELDQRLLHALEVDARASFSRIAAVLRVSDQTVARRFKRMRTEGRVRVVGVRDHTVLGQESWTLRLRCAPESAGAISRALARRPDTAWIALTSGGTEVVCVTRARSRGEHEELLLGKLPRTPRIVEIQAYQALHRFYGGPAGWFAKSTALTAEEVALLRPRYGAQDGPGADGQRPRVRITEEDEPLVAALEADGRASFAELQKLTGRSESALRRRLDQLLASGALYIDTQFDSEWLGHVSAAMLWITAAPAALASVGAAMAAHPEVVFAGAAAGPCNLLAVVLNRDTEALYTYLTEKLGVLEGVQHVECTPVLRRVKQLMYEEDPAGRRSS